MNWSSRKEYRRLYGTARWLRLRKRIRAEEPLCRPCSEKGKITASREIDHILRVEIWCGQLGNDFYDPENLQPICKQCHIDKGRAENSIGGKLGLKPGETLYDENGRPTAVMLAEIAKKKKPIVYS